jgi:hypothetical protein
LSVTESFFQTPKAKLNGLAPVNHEIDHADPGALLLA